MNNSQRKQKQAKTTVSMDFGQDALDRLNALRKKIEAPDNVTVIRNALQIYEWAVEAQDRGKRFYIGHMEQVKLFVGDDG